MAQVINTNIASLNAQRNLNSSQAGTNQALERLSSGLRINSAKDDAAGLAISNQMTAQTKGIQKSIQNRSNMRVRKNNSKNSLNIDLGTHVGLQNPSKIEEKLSQN